MNNRKRWLAIAVSLFLMFSGMAAGERLSLTDITRGEFAAESMRSVCPMPDGETYTQITDDGKRIVSYSFRTGKEVQVLFDVATARGFQLSRVDGYTRRLLTMVIASYPIHSERVRRCRCCLTLQRLAVSN